MLLRRLKIAQHFGTYNCSEGRHAEVLAGGDQVVFVLPGLLAGVGACDELLLGTVHLLKLELPLLFEHEGRTGQTLLQGRDDHQEHL